VAFGPVSIPVNISTPDKRDRVLKCFNGRQRITSKTFCCRFSCRLIPTLSGLAEVEQRQITLSVNDLQICCRTSYCPSVA
jgi:hypothetical protein